MQNTLFTSWFGVYIFITSWSKHDWIGCFLNISSRGKSHLCSVIVVSWTPAVYKIRLMISPWSARQLFLFFCFMGSYLPTYTCWSRLLPFQFPFLLTSWCFNMHKFTKPWDKKRWLISKITVFSSLTHFCTFSSVVTTSVITIEKRLWIYRLESHNYEAHQLFNTYLYHVGSWCPPTFFFHMELCILCNKAFKWSHVHSYLSKYVYASQTVRPLLLSSLMFPLHRKPFFTLGSSGRALLMSPTVAGSSSPISLQWTSIPNPCLGYRWQISRYSRSLLSRSSYGISLIYPHFPRPLGTGATRLPALFTITLFCALYTISELFMIGCHRDSSRTLIRFKIRFISCSVIQSLQKER